MADNRVADMSQASHGMNTLQWHYNHEVALDPCNVTDQELVTLCAISILSLQNWPDLKVRVLQDFYQIPIA